MSHSYARCLLLIAYDERIPDPQSFNIPTQQNRRRSLRLCVKKTPKKQMRVYALVPYSVRHDHDVCNMFSCSGITVIRTTKFDAPLTEAIKADLLEIVEILLKVPKSTETSNEIIVYADKCNEDILNSIFTGRRIESECISAAEIATVTECVFNKDNLNIFKELTCYGADIRYRHKYYGGTILHFAVLLENEALVRVLLQNGAQLETRTQDGLTPLHLAARYACDWPKGQRNSMPAISSHLIKHGANIHAVVTEPNKYEGVMPIHFAIESSNIRYISLLLNNGASVDADSVRGNVLKLAAACDGTAILSCVLLHRPSLNNAKNQKAFRYALKHSINEAVDLMEVYGFKIGPEDARDTIFLVEVIDTGKVGIINDLLQWGGGVYGQSFVEFLQSTEPEYNEDDLDYLFNDDEDDDVDNDDKVNRFTKRLLLGPGTFIWKLQVRAVEQSCIGPLKFLLRLDDSQSRVSLVNDVCWDDIGYWCKIILDSGDLRLSPIVDMDRRASPNSSELISDHITLVKAAELNVNESLFQNLGRLNRKVVPGWLLKALNFTPPINIVKQANALKKQKMGNLNLSYHDLLNMSVPKIVRLFKNNSLVREMETEDYKRRFPDYAPLIEWRFQRAHYRRRLLDRGAKMFAFLFRRSAKLPSELQEFILNFLSNLDLLVLVNLCKLPDSEE